MTIVHLKKANGAVRIGFYVIPVLGAAWWLGRGPALKAAAEVANAQLIDLAPTLLYLLGSPVPEDMDGKVLTSAFRPEFLTAHPVRAGNASGVSETHRQSGYTEQESAKVEERLRALGYLE